jgi:inorganic pyrophosphatase
MDKKAGTLVVDRFLYTPMRYPGNYGFIPHTLSEDGDPCDILVANTRPIIPGTDDFYQATDRGLVLRLLVFGFVRWEFWVH